MKESLKFQILVPKTNFTDNILIRSLDELLFF